MATKKTPSQAQRASSGANKSSTQANKNRTAQNPKSHKHTKDKVNIPVRLITSTVIAALFLFYFVGKRWKISGIW